jgi:hypothetical protein
LVSILIIGTVDYYDRFTAVAIFTVFIANTFLPYALFEFYNIDLNFFRNLPVKPGIILFQTVLILLILNLPEIIILHKNFSQIISSGLIALHVIVGLAALILLYAYLMYFNIDLKTYIIRIFWGSIFIYFLLLFDIPGYLLALVFLTLTIYFYFRGFYKFEMIYNHLKDR